MASVTILSDNGATSGSAGLKTSGGNDGVLLLQTTTSGGTPTTAISISNTQVVTYTNQPTYTGGTANGVLYLNGSKAVTSGTALVFDGTNLGIATSSPFASARLTVNANNTDAVFFRSADTNYSSLGLGVSTASGYTYIQSNASGTGTIQPLAFWVGVSERMRLDTSGNLLNGATSYNGFGSGIQVTRSTQPTVRLVETAHTQAVEFGCDNSGGFLQTTTAGSSISFYTGVATLAARVDSSGALTVTNQPAAQRFTNPDQSVANGTYTAIQLGTNKFTQNITYTADGRFTATVAGKYLFTAWYRYQSGSGFTAELAVKVNGSYYTYEYVSSAQTYQQLMCSVIVNMAVGDYIDIQAYQNSGGTLNITGNAQSSGAHIHKIC